MKNDSRKRHWGTEKYVELIAGFSVPADDYGSLSLLLGINPETGDWLPRRQEIERYYSYIRYCKPAEAAKAAGIDLWLRYFPDLLESPIEGEREFYRRLWREVFSDVQVLQMAYLFRPLMTLEAAARLGYEQKTWKRKTADEVAENVSDHRGAYTTSFPADGPPGKILESRAGLERKLKERLGLTGVNPGLIANYLIARDENIEDLLDPRQFEELVATLFREEGWNVELTQQTHDGGKDVIARRPGPEAPEMVYVEAKRYNASRAVSIGDVKEFAATLAGDRLQHGFLVTTSRLSSQAGKWLEEKGAGLATVEPIPGDQLEKRLGHLTGRTGLFEWSTK